MTRFSRKIITDMFVKGFSGINKYSMIWRDFQKILWIWSFCKDLQKHIYKCHISRGKIWRDIINKYFKISNLLYYFLLILHFLFQTMSMVWSITPQFWKSLLFTVPLRNLSESQSSRISKPIRKSTQFSSRKSPIPPSICQKPTCWFRFPVMVVHVGKKPSVWVEF